MEPRKYPRTTSPQRMGAFIAISRFNRVFPLRTFPRTKKLPDEYIPPHPVSERFDTDEIPLRWTRQTQGGRPSGWRRAEHRVLAACRSGRESNGERMLARRAQ